MNDSEAKLAQQHAMVELAMAQKKANDQSKVKAAKLKSDLANTLLARANDANQLSPGSVKADELDKLRYNAANEKVALAMATTEQQLAEDELKLAKVILQQANEQLKKREISSPIKAIVTQVHKQQGEWGRAGRHRADSCQTRPSKSDRLSSRNRKFRQPARKNSHTHRNYRIGKTHIPKRKSNLRQPKAGRYEKKQPSCSC